MLSAQTEAGGDWRTMTQGWPKGWPVLFCTVSVILYETGAYNSTGATRGAPGHP
jgi:hypothetical protein